MKQSILLLSACFIAGFTNGQEAGRSMLFQSAGINSARNSINVGTHTSPNLAPVDAGLPDVSRYSAKTTSTSGRWFNYAFLEDTSIGGGTNYGASYPYMWYTDGSIFPFGPSTSPTYQANNNVSVGTIFDPAASGFSSTSYYPTGIMAVNALMGYTVDSVEIAGIYHRNKTNHTDVDTLRLAYTFGPKGGATSNIGSFYTWGFAAHYPGHDTLDFMTLYFDSTKDRATQVTGGATPVYYQDIYLHETDTIAGLKDTVIKLSTSLVVPANNIVGLSITYRSGNPAANSTFADTVWRLPANTYKYDEFRPLFTNNSFGGTLQWPDAINSAPYIGWNMGMQQIEPAGRGSGQLHYFANFQLTSGTNPNSDQYPWISFHVVCPGCPVIGAQLGVNNLINPDNIKVYPNPANSTLNVSFITKASSVEVSLTNMLGMVVASHTTTTGGTVFNSSEIPAGVYVLSLVANGERTTGRVVIAH